MTSSHIYNSLPNFDEDVSPIDIQLVSVQFFISDNVGRICHSHMAFFLMSWVYPLFLPRFLTLTVYVCQVISQRIKPWMETAKSLRSSTRTLSTFKKTGCPAIMKPDLQAKEYPEYMEKKDRPSYESKKILGIIYQLIGKSPVQGLRV